MASFVHLTIQNATPQQRMLFVLGRKLDSSCANSIAFGAWQRFTLAPGGSDRIAVARSLQVAASSQIPDAQHQTILVDAAPGTAWDFGLDGDNAPRLTVAGHNGIADGVAVTNRTTGPALIGFHDNFAPLFPAIAVEPGATIDRGPLTTLYFYASVPLVGERQPNVVAPEIGTLAIPEVASTVIAEFRQDGNTLEWRFL